MSVLNSPHNSLLAKVAKRPKTVADGNTVRCKALHFFDFVPWSLKKEIGDKNAASPHHKTRQRPELVCGWD